MRGTQLRSTAMSRARFCLHSLIGGLTTTINPVNTYLPCYIVGTTGLFAGQQGEVERLHERGNIGACQDTLKAAKEWKLCR